MSNRSNSGIGLLGATFLILMTLKLLDKIDLSWWWVLWGPVALALGIGLLLLVGSFCKTSVER